MSAPQDELAATAVVLAEAPAPIPAPVVPLTTVTDRPVPLFDRELSWLEFNRRVLGEAENPDVPLLERVKFLSICSNNLDEFFMIRVGEVRDLLAAKLSDTGPIPMPSEKLDEIRKRSRSLLDQMYRCLGEQLIPLLKKEGIQIDRVSDLAKKERAAIEDYFVRNIEPILTPLAIDPGHPFPFIANLALNLALQLESTRGESYIVVVKIPEQSPRLVPLGVAGRYVLLEDVISSFVGRFFPGLKLKKSVPFRVIPNSDISIKEEDVQDRLKRVETELRKREKREFVWLEVDPGSPVIEALASAAQKGKQVTAVVEVQARFDELKNITWARHLEEAGVQVVYGLVGLKTHCKICLVVRREADGLRRYVHLSTGNYNAVTGRLYTDIDLFTADPDSGPDAGQL